MNQPASYLHCATCNESTLHTTAGCCRHPRPRVSHASPVPWRSRQRRSKGSRDRPRSATTTRAIGRPRSVGLTARETEAIELLAQGLTRLQVSVRLGVTPSTIGTLLRSAKTRVGAESSLAVIRKWRAGAPNKVTA